ncbi:phage tail assembly protein [Acinetobacter soli]|uniref:phage tail assembly protein n=1 Tax=Acinetobacter soli TaxID=487316 RepID=UPI00125D03FC|nr:phage tail assembly protein [Acinetobacter soli]
MENTDNENGVIEYPTPYDYQLISPVLDSNGVTVSSINLQEPTIAEVESLSDNTKKFNAMKAFKTMLANHTKLDIPTINKMGARDLNGIQKYYDYFLGE